MSRAQQWPVCVIARHVAAGHLGTLEMAKVVVDGDDLPPLTLEAIDQMNAERARKHPDCSKGEVLGLLRENGEGLVASLQRLSDADLDRNGALPATGAR